MICTGRRQKPATTPWTLLQWGPLLLPTSIFAEGTTGNWYTSETGVRVHRVDAFDTALAGKQIYDLKTGDVISPDEAFNRAPNKDGHRIAHWLKWMVGGRAACDLLRLRVAQERGIGQCQNFQINSDADMTPGLNWVAASLGGRSSSPRPSPAGRGRIGRATRHNNLKRVVCPLIRLRKPTARQALTLSPRVGEGDSKLA